MTPQIFDVIVVGAGSGGLTAAIGLSKIGKKVLLVEREHLGGECTNSGCIPSKALLHHAKAYHQATLISGHNGTTENFRREAFTYVRMKINEILEHETPDHFKKLGIDVLMGEAVFTSPTTLTVNGTSYKFKRAIIATGSSPRLAQIPGLDSRDILTNQNLFTLDTIPARTLIMGAGPIGLEMGQALAMLGSTVTILDNSPTFARLEDAALQPIIKQACVDLGITIIQSASIVKVEQGTALVAQENITQTNSIVFDKILIAIGRVPNIPDGLSEARIAYCNIGITVTANYQTTNTRVFAIGDVANALKFTHVADDTARAVVTNIATLGLVKPKTKSIPKVTYTEPELAQVGLSQIEAEQTYGIHTIHRLEIPFSNNDRARTDNDTSGIMVVIVKRLSGKIIGAHIAGPRAGELLALFSIAIDNNLSLWKLRRTMYAYPTYALMIRKAGDIFFATQMSSLKSDLAQITKAVAPKIILLLAWLIGLLYLYQYQESTGNTLVQSSLALFMFITTTTLGPLLYVVAYTLRPLTFFPGTALTILSGVFFGFWWGIVYTIIAANLSATFAYLVGRYFGGNLKLETSFFSRYVEASRKSPFITILTMRLLFLPFDGVNYAAGIIKIPYVPYIVATIIGTLLGIATFVSVGASLSVEEFTKNGITKSAIDATFLIISLGIFVTSLVMSKLFKKYY